MLPPATNTDIPPPPAWAPRSGCWRRLGEALPAALWDIGVRAVAHHAERAADLSLSPLQRAEARREAAAISARLWRLAGAE